MSLASSVRQSTGNTNLLSTLNNFDHCISKTKLHEIETATAEDHTETQRCVTLPTNIVPGVPLTFVWNKNDICEDIPTGKGTAHCTNGITIQPEVTTCKADSVIFSQNRTHRRSIRPWINQLENTGNDNIKYIACLFHFF